MLEALQNIFTDMVNGILSYVPNLLIALVILVVGWIIGRIVRYILERVLKLIHFDDIVARTELFNSMTGKRTPTSIFGMLVFWIIFLNFLLTAFDQLGLSQAVEPLRALIAFLPTLIVGFILLIIGALLAKAIADAVESAVNNMGIEFGKAIANGVRIILLGIVVIVVLQQMGIESQLLTDIFLYVIVILLAGLALAFGLGGRDVVRNVLAGFYAREMFALGDTISFEGADGTLEAIGTINAEIDRGGERILVPNTYLTENRVTVRRDLQ
jgi:small-conductance mechanosensitive channel